MSTEKQNEQKDKKIFVQSTDAFKWMETKQLKKIRRK